MVPFSWYVAVAAVLFITGMIGFLLRRNPLVMFMASEMMWNAAGLAFVAYGRAQHNLSAQVMTFMIIATAAAEVGIGLALMIAIFHRRHRLNIDDIAHFKG
ncbi:MAG: NADH-quinone oxidoreductase subunit NuoK [Firmicutes bacterium]|nr:NADH-quinone oxidoreductase subunit NuoK [Bacillota bacterium]